MKLKKVLITKKNKLWNIYEKSFPRDERRTFIHHLEVQEDGSFSFYCILDPDPIGLVSMWLLDDFIFIEHFAIQDIYRNQGIGTKVLNMIMEKSDKLLILEAPLPKDRFSKRRIAFYKRSGFKRNRFRYVQPAYEKNKKEVILHLMSSPKQLSRDEFIRVKKLIYSEVYKISQTF